ncbi:MAG TPA: caspase family protein, partial [Kofleriaceae bacterium]
MRGTDAGRTSILNEGRDVAVPPIAVSARAVGRRVIAAIGVDRYRHRHWRALSNAVSDAVGATALFQRLGFDEVAPPLLDARATGDAIEALVTDELNSLGARDSLIVFFAGHGSTRSQRVGGHDVRTGYLIPVDADPDRVASWIEIEPWLRRISKLPPRHILVILDACASGIALSGVKWGRGSGSLIAPPFATANERPSRVVITSALDDEQAMDTGPVPGHSLFTGCLIEALTGGVKPVGQQDGREVIIGSALGHYLRTRVQDYPGRPGWKQTPDHGTFDYDARGEMLIPVLAGDMPVAASAGPGRDSVARFTEVAAAEPVPAGPASIGPPSEPAPPPSEPAPPPSEPAPPPSELAMIEAAAIDALALEAAEIEALAIAVMTNDAAGTQPEARPPDATLRPPQAEPVEGVAADPRSVATETAPSAPRSLHRRRSPSAETPARRDEIALETEPRTPRSLHRRRAVLATDTPEQATAPQVKPRPHRRGLSSPNTAASVDPTPRVAWWSRRLGRSLIVSGVALVALGGLALALATRDTADAGTASLPEAKAPGGSVASVQEPPGAPAVPRMTPSAGPATGAEPKRAAVRSVNAPAASGAVAAGARQSASAPPPGPDTAMQAAGGPTGRPAAASLPASRARVAVAPAPSNRICPTWISRPTGAEVAWSAGRATVPAQLALPCDTEVTLTVSRLHYVTAKRPVTARVGGKPINVRLQK